MYSPASSPGPAYSDRGTPKKQGLLDTLKRGIFTQRAGSPTSSIGGSDAGTPKSSMFPSFTNGQRKRDIIKKLEEDLSLASLQVHQQEGHINKLQQQVQQEEAAKVDAQERLNMQYFKANLLADMMVMKLLDIELGIQPERPALTAAPQTVGRADHLQGAVSADSGQIGAAAVLQEDSFE